MSEPPWLGSSEIPRRSPRIEGPVAVRSEHAASDAASRTSEKREEIMGGSGSRRYVVLDVPAFPESVKRGSGLGQAGAGIDLPHPTQHHDAEMDALDFRPIALQRARLERHGGTARDARRRRHERREPVVHHASQRYVDTL